MFVVDPSDYITILAVFNDHSRELLANSFDTLVMGGRDQLISANWTPHTYHWSNWRPCSCSQSYPFFRPFPPFKYSYSSLLRQSPTVSALLVPSPVTSALPLEILFLNHIRKLRFSLPGFPSFPLCPLILHLWFLSFPWSSFLPRISTRMIQQYGRCYAHRPQNGSVLALRHLFCFLLNVLPFQLLEITLFLKTVVFLTLEAIVQFPTHLLLWK